MNRRVILSGCSGGGKSTLIKALAAKGFQTVEEAGRRVVEAELKLNKTALPWENMPLFLECAIELALRDFNQPSLNNSPVFYDRSLVDLILAYKKETGSSKLDPLLKTKLYNQTVFLVPPWEDIYVTDVARRHSFQEAVEEYERLRLGYPALGYEIEILPKADVRVRVDFVLGQLKNVC